jgi:preprotein translocase subunit SecG
MGTLETIFLILLVLDAIALGALILLQQGKGADIGAAFGSGAANAMFGGAGSASFLAKSTAWLAMAFFALSFGLAFMAKEHAASLKDIGVPVVNVPTVPAPTNDSTPASTNAAPNGPASSPAPTDSAPTNATPDSKLTPPGEPVDSSVPNV